MVEIVEARLEFSSGDVFYAVEDSNVFVECKFKLVGHVDGDAKLIIVDDAAAYEIL